MHTYLINLAYILGGQRFQQAGASGPFAPAPWSVEILDLWTSPGGWLPRFRMPRTRGITTASHTWADCVGSKRHHLPGGREDNLRMNYSPVRRSCCTGRMQMPAVGLHLTSFLTEFNAPFQPLRTERIGIQGALVPTRLPPPSAFLLELTPECGWSLFQFTCLSQFLCLCLFGLFKLSLSPDFFFFMKEESQHHPLNLPRCAETLDVRHCTNTYNASLTRAFTACGMN